MCWLVYLFDWLMLHKCGRQIQHSVHSWLLRDLSDGTALVQLNRILTQEWANRLQARERKQLPITTEIDPQHNVMTELYVYIQFHCNLMFNFCCKTILYYALLCVNKHAVLLRVFSVLHIQFHQHWLMEICRQALKLQVGSLAFNMSLTVFCYIILFGSIYWESMMIIFTFVNDSEEFYVPLRLKRIDIECKHTILSSLIFNWMFCTHTAKLYIHILFNKMMTNRIKNI